MTRTCPPTNLYHQDSPYRLGNSFRGIDDAVKAGCSWIDQDAQESKDHELWNMHWPWLYQDKFSYRGASRRRVRGLNSFQLAQVRSFDGFRPHKMNAMLVADANVGINSEVELKCVASNTALKDLLTRIEQLQKQHPHFRVRIKILQGVLSKRQILDTFERIKRLQGDAVVNTLYLNHTDKPVTLTARQQQLVDLVRGKWKAV
jgi:glycerophosphoryl diester phosphodiesterase